MQSGETPRNSLPEASPLPSMPAAEVEPVNVEQLMEKVRKAVEEKRRTGIYRDDEWAAAPPYALSGGPSPGDNLTLLRTSAQVDLEGEPIQSHRPITGAVVMAAKRFTRYWVRKYTDALFLRQSAFNAETVNTLAVLRREIEELKAEVARLKAAGSDESSRPRTE